MGLLCAWLMDQVWETFTRQKFIMFQLLYHNLLSGTTKNAEDCKVALKTLQESVKVCQSTWSRSHCFRFPCSVIPYTYQPGKTFSLTASTVLFPDLLETTASITHRIKSQSVWTPASLVSHQTQIVLIAAHSWSLSSAYNCNVLLVVNCEQDWKV